MKTTIYSLKLFGSVVKLQGNLNESQSEREQLENEFDDLQFMCEQLENDLAQSQSKCEQLENDLVKSQAKCKQLQDKNDELTSRSKSFIFEMKQRIDELEKTFGENKSSNLNFQHLHISNNESIAVVVKKEPKDDDDKHEV